MTTGEDFGRPVLGSLPALYLVGVPGSIGGAATKVLHLLRLLHKDFAISVVAPEPWVLKDKGVKEVTGRLGIPCIPLKDVPRFSGGIALGVCDKNFFVGGRARELKARGLRVVWSNEMMWPFEGEKDAVKEGLVDRVLFVSEFQAAAFADLYADIPSAKTGNYIDPDDFPWRKRSGPVFTLGRLSRPDTTKYPLDFPAFYEELGLKEVRFRVMAWSAELQRQYRWHRFGPEWDLLPAGKESALKFLYSLDLFLYPLGHRVKESWGRAVVEAMLTGCVPIVPAGHQFHKLIRHADTGFICHDFNGFRSCVRELYENYPLRFKMGRRAAEDTRDSLCSAERHRRIWVEALTF